MRNQHRAGFPLILKHLDKRDLFWRPVFRVIFDTSLGKVCSFLENTIEKVDTHFILEEPQNQYFWLKINSLVDSEDNNEDF